MQTKRALWMAVVGGSLLTAAGPMGCKDSALGGGSHSDSGGGGTAVVDMNKVARDMGWQTKMETNLQAYKEQLQKDANQFQEAYNQQVSNFLLIRKPKDADPKDPNVKITLSGADTQEFQAMIQAERQQLGDLSREADQLFNVYRMKWVKQYRDSLSPIVREVANDKKATVVIEQTDNVLFYDRTVDLTDAVVDGAKRNPPVLTEIEMTHLQGKPGLDIGHPAGQSATSQPAATQP